MCGNGIRAFAKWAHELGLVKEKRISVETGAGILYPEILDNGMVRVDMGCPHLDAKEIPAEGFGEGPIVNQTLANEKNGKSYQVTCVSMGNPHCVILLMMQKLFRSRRKAPTWKQTLISQRRPM